MDRKRMLLALLNLMAILSLIASTGAGWKWG